MEDSVLLFVYGTLMQHHTRVEALHHDAPDIRPAIALNMRRGRRGGYPTIEPAPGHYVQGEVFYASYEDLRRADEWEEKYRRIEVNLSSGDKAWAYILKDN